MQTTELEWVVGWTASPDVEPEEWIPATVPGNLQLDWAKAKDWPEWWVADNFRQYRWMEDVVWIYRTILPDLPTDPYLVLHGVDYGCEVRLRGQTAGTVEGMQVPLSVSLSGAEKGDCLEVRVASPNLDPWAGTDRERSTTKPGVFYGWDFAPRLVPIGIWMGVEVTSGPPFVLDTEYRLEGDTAEIQVNLWYKHGPIDRWTWELLSPTGEVLLTRSSEEYEENRDGEMCHECIFETLTSPLLWWPNGQGEQPLYTSRLISPGGVAEQRVGFRNLKLVPYEGMWSEGRDTPGTRWEPPITLEVNGRTIFGKGANWVPPSMLPGGDTRGTYEALLRQCKDAGFNLLRVWGGGNAPKDEFFELCDEMGLLVWQEFPLACARYGDEDDYLRVLDEEARSIVYRLRHHPSLAIWCGGNELFCPWSGMTDQDAALRHLNTVCYNEDPSRPFLATSPLMGMAHGGYTFVYSDGREGLAAFQEARATAYTEFGSSGVASAEVLRSFMPEEELWPPKRGTSWETHNGFSAWDGHRDSWLMLPMLEEYFGPFESLEDMLWAGQLLQAEGLRHCYEEARRQKPRCSMALAWCLNEPWPTAANNSLISWPAVPKPAMRTVTDACRPTLLSLRIPKFRWSPGEAIRVEPFILNDAYQFFNGGTATIMVEKREVARWRYPAVAENRNVRGEPLEFRLPELGRKFEITIGTDSQPDWSSTYTLGRLNGS